MKTQRTLRRTILAMALAALGTSAGAQVAETEPNEVWAPQLLGPLSSGGSLSVTGAIEHLSTSTPDSDFYSFDTQQPDTVVNVNIAAGVTRGLCSDLTLYDGTSFAPLLIAQGNCDPQVGAVVDPAFGPYVLAVPGPYIVAVSTPSGTFNSGPYTLNVADVTPRPAPTPTPTPTPPEMQYIKIDIKPGHSQRARINPNSRDAIAVALLSSKQLKFYPQDVDQATLTFGATGDEDSLRRCAKHSPDLNRDGIPDLVCHFQKNLGGFERGDTTGKVKGKTKARVAFEGLGDLKVVKEKREKRHRSDRDRDHDRDHDRKRNRDRDD